MGHSVAAVVVAASAADSSRVLVPCSRWVMETLAFAGVVVM
jgi:hypothetical protein